MPPLVQNTFSVIPDVPSFLNSRSNGSNTALRLNGPPMTTKQVKKAYQKATKRPTLSKAEQRRQELFEQDRIRKEFEKERNQARARAARDKKKEKEALERAERKTKGLPLVDVRPSQGTIAGFVRSRKSKPKKRDESSSPLAAPGDDGIEEESPSLSHIITRFVHPQNSKLGTIDESDSDSPLVASGNHRIEEDPPSSPIQKGPKSLREDRVSLPGVINDGGAERESSKSEPNHSEGHISLVLIDDNRGEDIQLRSTLQNGPKSSHEGQRLDDTNKENIVPHPKRISQSSSPPSRSGSVNRTSHGLKCKPPLSNHAEPPRKKRRLHSPKDGDKQTVCDNLFDADFSEEDLLDNLIRKTDREHASLTPLSNKAQFRQREQGVFIEPPSELREKPKLEQETPLPPSTQLFLLSHLDDFFPSPSQEVREIFEEPKPKLDGNRNKATVASIQKTTPGMARKEIRHTQYIAKPPKPRKATILPSAKAVPPKQSAAFEMPFFSTQDFLLSSQDIKDIEETPLPPKTNAPMSILSKSPVKTDNQPRPSPKRLFTSTCRELSYKYAIQRSKSAAREGPRARQKARRALDRLQALEDERLAALLADSGDKENINETTDSLAGGGFAAKADTQIQTSHATPPRSTPKPQDQPLRPVRPNTQRNTRTKSSYEAMLELLAKRPTQRKQCSAASADENRDKSSDTVVQVNTCKKGQTPDELTMAPSSQETDYDRGEEWDDDDLLRELL